MASGRYPDTGSGGSALGTSPSQCAAFARAVAKCGTSMTKAFGSDFEVGNWNRQAGVGGTAVVATAKKGGVLSLSTTSTANRTSIIMPLSSGVELDSAQTSRWYLNARFSVTSSVDAAAGADLRWTAVLVGAPQIILGVIGSISTTHFAWLVQNNAGAVVASGATTVPIDTAMHLFEMWSDATTITFAIDGVDVATSPASNAGTNPVARAIAVANGATAAARTMDLDFTWACMGDPA